jgi:hypothetical protein
MKIFQILIIVLFFSTKGISQHLFGIEIRTSNNITFNSSVINGGGNGFSVYEVTKESNAITSSYSVGLNYNPDKRSVFKLHFGNHQNGRIIDLTEYDDTGSVRHFVNVDSPYNYLQIVPSYAYNLYLGKFSIPIELGFAINKRIREEKIFYIGIKEYNYDFRLSSGIQYKLKNFSIGSNIVYSNSIGNYETEYVRGEYKPYQIGIELGIGYTLIGERKNSITNK